MPKRDWVEKYFSSKTVSVSFDSSDPEVLVVIDKLDIRDDDTRRCATTWTIPADRGKTTGKPKLVQCLTEVGDKVKEISTPPASHREIAKRVARKLGAKHDKL